MMFERKKTLIHIPIRVSNKASDSIQVLPDLFAICPFEEGTNPHYDSVRVESSAWMNSYNVFVGPKRTQFEQILPELLISHELPYADVYAFRLCCYYVNLAYGFEEMSDELDGKGVQVVGDSLVKTLGGDPCDGSLMSVMAEDFMSRFGSPFSPTLKTRFVAHNRDYVDAVVKKATLRERGAILSENEYRNLRRDNGAMIILFNLIEVTLGIELPVEVHGDSNIKQIYLDLILFTNDVLSYKTERSRGLTEFNLITVLMHNNGMSLQEATDHIGVICQNLVQQMVSGPAAIRSFGADLDADVHTYVKALERMVMGNLKWSFETKRFWSLWGKGQEREDRPHRVKEPVSQEMRLV